MIECCFIVQLNNKNDVHFEKLQAVTDEQRQNAEKVGKECAAANGLTLEDMQKIRTDPKTSVKDPKAQVYFYLICYMAVLMLFRETNSFFFRIKLQKFGKCFLEKIGFIDQKGDFQESVAIEKLSKGEDRAKIEEIVKQCKSTAGDNKDESPIKLYACYLEKKALKA